MSEPTVDRDPFEVVAESFLARFRAGERPSIEDLAARNPDLADQIRELLPALVMVEQELTIDREPRSNGTQPAPALAPGKERRLGDYRILREIGRGGMGVVYEAEQVSLRRQVALKVLSGHVAADRKALERFRREAKAAARLHHTNIVPVFEVGRDDDVVFYAMQFIQGQGLDQVIEELKRVADEGRNGGLSTRPPAVAAAPGPREAAIGRAAGTILHGRLGMDGAMPRPSDPTAVTDPDSTEPPDRDLTTPAIPEDAGSARIVPAGPPAQPSPAVLPGGKPMSVVESSARGQPFFRNVAQIGRQAAQGLAYAHTRGIVHRDIKPSNLLLDTAGVVWIADFGLAKTEEDGLTATGDIVGTIRFMAPERFRGEGDARADIYALGLTLYELLTLRPAFDASDRLKLIEQIKSGDPPRPRSLDGRIPRDLETIVLKAIQRDPALRYQSASDLGDDLLRYLEDRTIRARRTTLIEQTLRWCRRNPAVASLIAAVLLATVTGAGFATFFAIRAENERRKAVEREHDAVVARNLAEDASAQAASARKAAEESSDEARKRLTRLYVFTGSRYQDGRDTSGALLWFHRAWEQDQPDSQADASHRARMAGALTEMPDLIGACFHKTTVCDAIFSPDGRRVLVRTDGNEAYLWDYERSQLAAPALVHGGRVRHVCYSPDGKSVATASADGTARVWDSATGAERFILKHDGPLTWVAFHPDGRRVATSAEDGTVRLWSATDGKPLDWRLPVETVIDHLAFSPDGSRLVTAGRDKLVRVWQVDPPKAISPTLPYRQPTDTERYTFNQDCWPKFAPDGRAVLSSDGTGLQIWAGGQNDAVRTIPLGSSRWVVEMYFVPNSDRALVTGNSSVAKVVDLNHGRLVHELATPRHASIGAVSPDGKWLLTCSSGGLVTLWDAATGLRAGPPQRCGDFCSAVAFSPDGSRYLASSQDGTVRVWATGPRTPASHPYRYDCGRANLFTTAMTDKSTHRSYSPDGQHWVEWTKDGKAWYVSSPRVAPRPIPHPGPVEVARFCDDGSRVVIAGSGAIRAWDVDTLAPAGPVVAAATLTDPLWRWSTVRRAVPPGVAASSAGPRENGGLTSEPLRSAQLSRNGARIVCLDDEKTLSVWDLATGRRVFGPALHPDPGPQIFGDPSHARWVSNAVLSPDGRQLAVGIDSTGTLTVWGVDTGKVIHHNRRFRGYIRKLQFSDDGRRILLFASDGLARLYDADTGIALGPAISQPGVQPAVDVSPDGRLLAVHDQSLQVFRVFDVERGERLLTIPYGNRNGPTALWFDAAGRSLNAVIGGAAITFPLPRFDVPFADSAALLRLLTGQQIDETDGMEYIDQFTFKKAPDEYRDVFRRWKGLPVNLRGKVRPGPI